MGPRADERDGYFGLKCSRRLGGHLTVERDVTLDGRPFRQKRGDTMKEMRTHGKVRTGWICLGIGLAAIGCGAPAERAEEQGENRSDLVKYTEVKKDDQGQPVVRTFYRTKEQAARELAARIEHTKRVKE